MKYLKIRISENDCPNKFYRTVLVNPKINLYQFSIYIEILFKALFCHMCYFESKNHIYEDKLWLDDIGPSGHIYHDYIDVTLAAALKHGEDLTFVYDSGEDYCFKLDVIGDFEFPLRMNVILLEASGEGIWEDNRSGLCHYLSGKYTDKDIYVWNYPIPHDISKYDFFAPINVERWNDKLENERKNVIKELKKNGGYSDIR